MMTCRGSSLFPNQPPTNMKTHTCLAAAVLAAASLAPATLRAAAPPSAPATSATAASSQDEPLVLSIFQVTSDKDEGYRSTQTISEIGRASCRERVEIAGGGVALSKRKTQRREKE